MKRVFACLALVTMFVLSFPALSDQQARSISGITTEAKAGRLTPNMTPCECGSVAECICDPGEQPCTSCPNQGMAMQPTTEAEPKADGIDTGAGLTLLITTILLVLRLRQNI